MPILSKTTTNSTSLFPTPMLADLIDRLKKSTAKPQAVGADEAKDESTDYTKMKVQELKDLCITNDLETSGLKRDLIERLVSHFEANEEPENEEGTNLSQASQSSSAKGLSQPDQPGKSTVFAVVFEDKERGNMQPLKLFTSKAEADKMLKKEKSIIPDDAMKGVTFTFPVANLSVVYAPYAESEHGEIFMKKVLYITREEAQKAINSFLKMERDEENNGDYFGKDARFKCGIHEMHLNSEFRDEEIADMD